MNQSQLEGAGLLLAMMEPPQILEAEFQDWYDTEHFPERAETEGFLTARRFVCLDGWPRYLALYDLTDVGVLHGEEYAKIARERYSRWTNRIIPKTWGHYRAEGTQVYPGKARLGAAGNASRIMIWRFSDVADPSGETIIGGLRDMFEDLPETAQTRIFSSKREDATDYLGIIELYAPVALRPGAVAALGEARRHLDMVNTYTPYFKS